MSLDDVFKAFPELEERLACLFTKDTKAMRLVELQRLYESGGSLYGVDRKISDDPDDYQPVVPAVKSKETLPPDFWKWFGKSKVKDTKGNPLVVYHGTTKSGFQKFSQRKRGSQSGHEREDVYFHFTDDPRRAEAYSASYLKKPGSGTYAVFLRIENPLYVNFPEEDFGEVFADDFEKAKQSGKDGLIVNYVDDSLDRISTEFIVFSSRQIKSAIGNKGSYSRRSGSIQENRS